MLWIPLFPWLLPNEEIVCVGEPSSESQAGTISVRSQNLRDYLEADWEIGSTYLGSSSSPPRLSSSTAQMKVDTPPARRPDP